MAGLHLVPIPIAITLIALVIITIPLIPAAWVWMTVSGISQAIRQGEQPGTIARTIGRWIGLSAILPWAAILVLWLMIAVQVLLTPLLLVHQLRDLRETVTWLFTHLELVSRPDNTPTPAPSSTPIDTSSLPPYIFTPLPSTSPTAIRILTIHPDSPTAPIRGTISTTTLSSPPTYDALSYTRCTTPTTTTPPPHNNQHTLLLLTTPDSPLATPPLHASTSTWTTHPIPSPCAAALRRLRHPHKPRRVWVDAVCVNSADAAEKSRQVAALDRIYCGARRVVAYVGEAGEGSDGLFEWVNGLRGEEEQYRVAVLGLAPVERAPPPEDVARVLGAFFDRPWFKQLWPLQEVALPDLARVHFMCGDKTTTGTRIVHLSKLQGQDQAKGWDVARLSRPAQQPSPHGAQKQPCLLDLLLETQHLECEDPRDKIFAVLNIAKRLDGAASAPTYLPDYGQTVSHVYATYSSLFIETHGPGFILALIKSPPNVEGLPSWSTDWTVPWPDHRALGATASPRRYRTPNEKDGVVKFDMNEDQQLVMTLVRPRVVRGFFAREGPSSGNTRPIENVRQLRMDEVLVEVYPGLALLLRQQKGKPEHYAFVRACPHALTREGVEKAVANWSSVVLQECADPLGTGPPPKGYLSLPGVYKIM
ncbi:heterokaryon incompatibility protein-domain-containing protein [Chaetomium sp. MPI-CAGE-AT-0009]|nr:heterokaryon incompatibility protein-domain-containing protein [Chaetomium sp. MPI-CAGE-AT-0009]